MTPCSAPALRRPRHHRSNSAFKLMEVIVVIAILIVVVAISFPIIKMVRGKANKQKATEKMVKMGKGIATYVGQNNGVLPMEDADGSDSWVNIAKPEAKDAWYNALPTIIGEPPASSYATSPAGMYADASIFFLPGANYPENKKLREPVFAYAFNTKLQTTDAAGNKTRTKFDSVLQPTRTVALLEQGLPNEDRTLEQQSKRDYDGSPKGSAKSFVGRYNGEGVIVFLDGHAEMVAPGEVLNEKGEFNFPQGQYIWTANPEDNPNKDAAEASAKRKAKNPEGK